LLAFARLSRAPLHQAEVNMSLLATECFEEVCPPEQNLSVEFLLHDLPPASADESMVRQVFLNLYSNSIKFRKTTANSWIETGFIQLHGQTVYFVSDNGIGFNMKSAAKLFEVFERLTAEFEGTGVGLAIVQQIIKRHGGSVAGYGEPGIGTTFYFSLAPVKEFASVTDTFGPTRHRGGTTSPPGLQG
ncbi:MAG: hypothetical protein JWM04_1270, partial [Verrucomicrobiales bacterium]|nr:hypothetical protein [Verrucomicrobiales bacterium]